MGEGWGGCFHINVLILGLSGSVVIDDYFSRDFPFFLPWEPWERWMSNGTMTKIKMTSEYLGQWLGWFWPYFTEIYLILIVSMFSMLCVTYTTCIKQQGSPTRIIMCVPQLLWHNEMFAWVSVFLCLCMSVCTCFGLKCMPSCSALQSVLFMAHRILYSITAKTVWFVRFKLQSLRGSLTEV